MSANLIAQLNVKTQGVVDKSGAYCRPEVTPMLPVMRDIRFNSSPIAATLMRAAVVLLIVVAATMAGWAQSSCPASPNYSPDFSSNQSCMTLNGNYGEGANALYPAFTSPAPPPAASAPAGVSKVLRLTPAVGGWATSGWFNTTQPVVGGFSTTFLFQISDTSSYNADGLAFLVQNSTESTYYGSSTSAINALAYGGCAVGFGEDSAYGSCAPGTGGIPASAAVQFKTFNDGYPTVYPNTANSVSIMSNGTGANCIDASCAIAVNNSLQIAGAVTTSGTTVTWVSGSQFNPSWTPGTAILINGTSYSIASVASTTSLMLSSAPPANASPVAYSVGAPVAGTVNTSGTTVTWVSGSQFNTSWDPGTQILINGVAYTIASVASTSSLTLSTNPPTLTGSPYSVGIILDDGNVHTVTITYTPTPTQSVSPNCFSGTTARPCIDVILDGIDLFGGGVYFDLTTLGLASGTNAWVGFTAGNAGGNDDEDILDWTFTPQSQSQTGTVTPTTPATYPYNGGCTDNGSGCTGNGFTNTVGENPASTLTINNLVLTEIPIISGNGSSATANQTACNAIVQANPAFVNVGPLGQTAQCFVYQNGGGTGIDAPVMFAVSCPPSGICDTTENQFFAAMASYFTYTCTENPPLIAPTCSPVNSPSSFGNFGNLTTMTGLPSIGFLQGAGPDANNPCNPATGSNPPPLFQSNQIVSYTLGDTSSKPVKGGSTLLSSCWVATYDTPGEMPTASISGPTNGAIYQQGAVVPASYTCNAVSTAPDSTLGSSYPSAGPYLTVSTCSATSGSGGGSTSSSCTATYPPALNMCNGTINLDTTDIGPQTLTVDVEDSATNTAQQQVTYTVVGATDVAIANVASPITTPGSKLTYVIGVGDLGSVNALNTIVNDTLSAGTTFVSASGSNVACSIVGKKLTCPSTPISCTSSGSNVSCDVGTIMPLSLSDLNGAVISITVKVTATGTIKNPTLLSNTATVSESNTDTKPSNNTATAKTNVE